MIIVHCNVMFCANLSHTLFKDMLIEVWWEQEIENCITKVELVWGK
jgi:hypothetical protein